MFTKLHNLQVKFRHDRTAGLTECIIPTEEDVYIGARAKCSRADNFCRETGRRLSLLRAMKLIGLTREQRFNEWEAYRKGSPKPKWPRTELAVKDRTPDYIYPVLDQVVKEEEVG